MEKSNLPIEVKNTALTIQNRRQIKRVITGLKKIGKIALSGAIGFVGIGVSVIGRTNWSNSRYWNLCGCFD